MKYLVAITTLSLFFLCSCSNADKDYKVTHGVELVRASLAQPFYRYEVKVFVKGKGLFSRKLCVATEDFPRDISKDTLQAYFASVDSFAISRYKSMCQDIEREKEITAMSDHVFASKKGSLIISITILILVLAATRVIIYIRTGKL